jgi:hypothetical protein
MKLKKDDIVYYADAVGNSVRKGVMLKNLDTSTCIKDWEAYVKLDVDNHASYLMQDCLYFVEDNAKKRVELEREIYNLRNSDLAQKCTDEMFNEFDKKK